MLCGSERLRLRSGESGDAERYSIRNSDRRSRACEHFRCRQSTIRDSISSRVAAFAGAMVGLFFGLFLLWLTVASVRAVGALAEGQAARRSGAAAHGAQDATSHALDVRRRFLSESNDSMPALAICLPRLKNSLELGLLGSVLKNTDPISQRTYETLEKAGSVLSSPERAQKLLT